MVKRIAIVTASRRPRRLSPFVSAYVQDVFKGANAPGVLLDHIDLKDQALPISEEPGVPKMIPAVNPTQYYETEEVRNWSRTVLSYDAFVFVLPQYNSSVPASLKSALDYLYQEWKGKPAGVVTFGTRGGLMAADHLRTILTNGLHMAPVPTNVGLPTKGADIGESEQLGKLSPEITDSWKQNGYEDQLLSMYSEIVQSLA